MVKFILKLEGEPKEIEELVSKGGNPLRYLCQKEVECFDQYVRSFARDRPDIGSDYATGIPRFEREAIEGYLYQKLKGRVGEKDHEVSNDSERKNG